MERRLVVGIVTPAARSSNNGNWQTAWRWSRLLADRYKVMILSAWQGERADVLLALHARRSAPSIDAWHKARVGPLAVVLTGTDLYRDIEVDPVAQDALRHAQRLVVLQELGTHRLPPDLRDRTVVCFQSCGRRQTLAKPRAHLRAVMVGHLRDEKSPETFHAAARLLRARSDIRLDHVGAALDAALGEQARAVARANANYRWLGALDHATTRRYIQRAHVLVHCSRIEGGPHVIAEAIRSGTPVIASRIDGNVGMLGANYGGYFDWNDAPMLARMLARARDEPAVLATLAKQCRTREALFDPRRERATLRQLVHELLDHGI